MKKILSALLAAVFLITLTGCQGYREIDSEYLISAVGFEHKDSKYKVFAEVLAISSDKKDTESKLFYSTGETPYEAVSNIAAMLPKKAVFDHCSTAIIGTGIKGGKLKKVIKYLYDTKNLNLGICLYTADDVKKVLSCDNKTLSAGYDIMAIKSNNEKTTGISFKNKYYEICGMQMTAGGFSLPDIELKADRPAIVKQTVFFDFSPVCVLTKDEALIFNLLRGGSKGGEINISGKKCRVNGIKSNFKAERDTLYVNLKCNYRQHGDELNNQLKTETEKVINKLKNTAALNLLSTDIKKPSGKIKVKVYD